MNERRLGPLAEGIYHGLGLRRRACNFCANRYKPVIFGITIAAVASVAIISPLLILADAVLRAAIPGTHGTPGATEGTTALETGGNPGQLQFPTLYHSCELLIAHGLFNGLMVPPKAEPS